MVRKSILLVVCLIFQTFSVFAGEADIIRVDIEEKALGSYDFAVTVTHEDTGWDHYADRWEIVDGDGNILETRVLYHPHVNQQPFTRSLPGVEIPGHLSRATVRAHDSVHGYGGKVVDIDLPGRN